MPKISVFLVLVFLVPFTASSQDKPSPAASASVVQATKLSETGHCSEALPVLKRSASHVTDRELKRRAGLAGVRCAMNLNQPGQAIEFLQRLGRDFPGDPEG